MGSGLIGAYCLRRAFEGEAVAAWERLLQARLWLSRCRQK